MVDASVLLKLKATAREAKKEVNNLGRDMKKDLQQNLRSDIDIDDSEIDKTKAKLELLERNIDVNFDTNDPRENFTADLDLNKESVASIKDSAEDYLPDETPGQRKSWKNYQKMNDILNDRNPYYGRAGNQQSNVDIPESLKKWRKSGAPQRNIKDNIMEDKVNLPSDYFDDDDNKGKKGGGFRNIKKRFKQLKEGADDISKSVGGMIPSMQTWWRIVGALVPLLGTLGVAALGVAGSLGAIAAAGAGVVGLGLIGHGESLADSMSKAEGRINKVKRELYDTFQPALQEFAPISDRFMSSLPRRLRPISEALREITDFEDPFNRLFEDVVGYIADAIRASTNWIGIMEQLGRRFLSGFVDSVGKFVSWMITTLRNEQDVIMRLANSFIKVVSVIWQFIKVISHTTVVMRPLVNVIAGIANLMSNQWIATIVSITVAMYLYITAVNAARYSMIAFMSSNFVSWASQTIAQISKMGGMWAWLTTMISNATRAQLLFWGAATMGAGLVLFEGLKMATGSLSPETGNYGTGNGGAPNGSGSTGSSPTYNATINVGPGTSRSDRLKMGEEATKTFRKLEEQDGAQEY